MKKCTIVAFVGIVLGIIGARYIFVNSPLSLIPWGIVGLVIGYCSSNTKKSLGLGAVYGFLLAYSFMLASYNGAEPIATRLLPFVIFGVVGAACGGTLAIIGFVTTRYMRKSK